MQKIAILTVLVLVVFSGCGFFGGKDKPENEAVKIDSAEDQPGETNSEDADISALKELQKDVDSAAKSTQEAESVEDSINETTDSAKDL